MKRKVSCERTNQVGDAIAVGRAARSFPNSSALSLRIRTVLRLMLLLLQRRLGHVRRPPRDPAAAATAALMALKYDVISVDRRRPCVSELMKRKIALHDNIVTDRRAN